MLVELLVHIRWAVFSNDDLQLRGKCIHNLCTVCTCMLDSIVQTHIYLLGVENYQ